MIEGFGAKTDILFSPEHRIFFFFFLMRNGNYDRSIFCEIFLIELVLERLIQSGEKVKEEEGEVGPQDI